MLRTAAALTHDLKRPRAIIYWVDMLAAAVIGYGALMFAASARTTPVVIAAGIVSVLALYRALSFIHEVSHIKHAALPGFRLIWNIVVGIPMLVPSFMYDGIHNLHHAKSRYGTKDDPEYLSLALMMPSTLLLFILVSAMAPVGVILRFAVLTPLSLLSKRLRLVAIERYSSLTINPSFRRRMPTGDARKLFMQLEAAASVWAIMLLAMVAYGTISLHGFIVGLIIGSSIALLNQVRTLTAHLWENEGEAMSLTAQYLDSVNVPPPTLLPMLWAPVGLRYHALHHLLPSLPYHALGEAHRRLTAALGVGSSYHKANHPGLFGLVSRITRKTRNSDQPR
ncbi:fatty acid desaturase family protein [Sphingomonas ginsenosidivorax]|nr:fatty acid desaturase [Sphingomonas ginsenosidivorax]